ncbi:uncharacterized protein LOC111638391 [Centruroides sculpturatus]|uniref:uncharacterized protein LOC111638391 n=1 Tax=Centruroides sculpturatus TaxID=218467 RepID=UPI000C6ECF7E|nr:uncharacterized protein LOC111638391 [Centruroides sculpturatus]
MRWRSRHYSIVHSYLFFFFLGVSTKELYRRIVCENEDLHLECAPRSFLAIHNASFTTDVFSENITCMDFNLSDNICTEDIRIQINRRCSGLNECTYNFVEDMKDRKCKAQGAMVILYDCVRESWLHRYCNTHITATEGYIMSPGYPLYYPQLSACNWNVEGGEGQTVLVSVLHLSMSLPSQYYGRYVCHDSSISIMEGSNKLFTGCGESLETLKAIESETNEISMQLFSSSFTPASGFLFYFKLQGCATLPAPLNGHLVYRNGSVAIYNCCRGYLFNDTLESSRTLQCTEQNRWNSSLPACLSLEELGETHNLTDFSENLLLPTNTTENEALVEPVVSSDTFLEDIIIPTVILVALLVGNAVILYIILHIRRRQKQKQASEEGEALNTTHITTSTAAQGTNV